MEYFPGFTTLQLCNKSKSSCQKCVKSLENFQDESSSCRCLTASRGDLKTISKNADQALNSFQFVQKDLHQEGGHSSDLDQKKKWYSTHDSKPQGECDRVAELSIKILRKWTSSFPCHESIVPRSARKQRWWKIINGDPIETVLRTIISVNQLSIYGAVSDLCDECKSCHVRTGRLVLAGQSDPLFVPTSSLIKTPTPSTDDPAQRLTSDSTS